MGFVQTHTHGRPHLSPAVDTVVGETTCLLDHIRSLPVSAGWTAGFLLFAGTWEDSEYSQRVSFSFLFRQKRLRQNAMAMTSFVLKNFLLATSKFMNFLYLSMVFPCLPNLSLICFSVWGSGGFRIRTPLAITGPVQIYHIQNYSNIPVRWASFCFGKAGLGLKCIEAATCPCKHSISLNLTFNHVALTLVLLIRVVADHQQKPRNHIQA